ncbi:MAG: phage tail tape measure protein [Chloroflexi bacterium]|nr:phage tail tape measure protein [Chloroflexota bacterium]MBP7042373.1 phage tail tape measure protein [Chloroflexota bacterium]
MSAELGDAVVYLSSENAQLKKDLDNAQKHTEGWLSQLGMGINIALGNALVSAVGKGIQAVGNLGKSVLDFSLDSQKAVVYLQSELGATADEAQILGDVAQAVWKNNFGADVLEAAAVVGQVRQQLKSLNTEGIQGAAQLALALRDAYGPQTQESIDAARTLMEDFNLTYQQAFDFIAAGYQKGLDRSGDFLDSITEYAPQFASAQAGAGQFFSAMETGLQGGMLGTDRALDMFKEFRVRLLDGSTTTADGLKQIGLSVDDISTRINNGSLTWTDAFTLVQSGIRDADSQAVQMQAGVALLGTQFEDMGVQAALSVDLASVSMEELVGAADAVNVRYNNLGDFFQGMGRKLTAALAPAGDALLDIANDAMPELEAGFQSLEANAVPFAVGLAAIFKGLAGLAKAFFGGFRKDANSEMGGTANEAGSWGRNIVLQLARGMAAAATAVVRVLNFIGGIIADWLSPGSPPRLLPDIDDWGTAAMQEFLDGMGEASVGALRGMGGRIMDTLGGIQEAGLVGLFSTISGTVQRLMQSTATEDDSGLVGRIMGSRGVVAQAIADIQAYGRVTDATLSAIQQSMVGLPPVANDYVQAMIRLYQANQAVTDAQEELNRVTQEYDDKLSPLRAELEGIQNAQANEADEKRIAALRQAIARGALNDEQKAQALREIRARELAMQIRAVEKEKETAVDAAQEKLDAAEAEQQAAEDAVALQQALIDAQLESNGLIQEQISLLDRLAQTMTAVGAGIADALGGAGEGGLGQAIADGLGLGGDMGLGEDPLGLTSMFENLDIDQLVADITAEFEPLRLEIEGFGDIWGPVGEKWTTWWGENGQTIADAATAVWDTIKSYFLGQLDALRHGFNAWAAFFKGDFDTFGQEMQLMWETIWQTMVDLLGTLWEWIEPHLANWWLAFKTWFDEQDWAALALYVMQNLIDTYARFWSLAVTTINGWWTAHLNWFNTQDWKALGYKVVYGILEALTTFWDNVGPTVNGWWTSYSNWFYEQDWPALGRKIVDGVISGLEASARRLVDTLLGVAQGAKDAWDDFWDNRSPSHLMEDSAGQIMAGVGVGLQKARDRLAAEMNGVGAAMFGGWQVGSQSVGAPTAAPTATAAPVVVQFTGDIVLNDQTAVAAFLSYLSGIDDAGALNGAALPYGG